MRLWGLLPVSLLSVVCECTQLPIEAQRVTLVDVLSAHSQYSSLLQLLQRTRLVPTLNKMRNATLFAPTNAALSGTMALYDDFLPDNVQAALRRQLLYHLVNATLPLSNDTSQPPQLLETLLFPHPKAGEGAPGNPPDSGEEPDGHSLLGGEGQKLEWSKADSVWHLRSNDQQANVLGSNITRAGNGLVLPVDHLLQTPKSVSHVLLEHPLLSKIRSLYSTEQLEEYATRANLTLFVPVDKAWEGDALDELEWKYLRSGFAQKDLLEVFQNHAASSTIGYAGRLAQQKTITTLAGHEVVITNENNELKLNDSKIVEADILASNGVVHLIDRLLLPAGSLALTPEKYLLALNCTRFVSLLRSANLSSLVQTDEPLTILAPSDEVVAAFEEREWSNLPESGTQELRDMLRYHIIKGKWTGKELSDGMLLDSSLVTGRLKGGSQKVPVSVTSEKEAKERVKKVGFGDANVLGDPIEIGTSMIYLVSQILEPPADVLQTAMSDLRLSTFVAAIYAASLDKQLKNAPAITFMAPVNAAFSSLGLTMSYLLLPTSKTELRKVMRYHAIHKLAYRQDLRSDSRLPTLEGTSMYVETNGSSVALRGPTSHGFPASGQLELANVTDSNILTSTGVLHVLDQALLPPTLDISIEKLLKGAKANTMTDLLRQANMTWVMRGEQPPDGFSVSSKHSKRRRRHQTEGLTAYTVLCPLDRAFNRINLTRYINDKEALVDLLKLHIIPFDPAFPADGKPLTLSDDTAYDTLLSKARGGPSKYGRLAFRRFGDDEYLVGIQSARGSFANDWAHIVSFGRATPRFETSPAAGKAKMISSGGVFSLDAVLEPYKPDWFHRWGWIVVVVLLCTMGLAAVVLLSVKLWRSRKTRNQYEALENEED